MRITTGFVPSGGISLSVPRCLFDTLVEEARAYDAVADHVAYDGQGKKGPPTIPVRIKLAAILYWMRHGGPISVGANAAGVDMNTVRRFGRAWAKAVMQSTFRLHVHEPCTDEEISSTLNLHARMGFPGCLGSPDGVSIPVEYGPWVRRNSQVVRRRRRLVASSSQVTRHSHGVGFLGWNNQR